MSQQKRHCQNCHSQRREVKGRGLCSKCFSWQRKIEGCRAKLELIQCQPAKCRVYRPISLAYQIRVAARALEELRWREAGLLSKTVDVERLESLVCALARDSKSSVALNMTYLIQRMSAASRRQMYEVLLVILEGLPFRRPALHGLQRPRNGAYERGGWLDWQNSYTRSEHFAADVKFTRELEAVRKEGVVAVPASPASCQDKPMAK